MKKLTFIILLMLAVNTFTYAQRGRGRGRGTQVKWLNFELKGGFGGSMLFNSDVISDPSAELSIFSPAYEVGGRLGLIFGDYIGVGVEVLKSGFNQDYNIGNASMQSYSKTQNFKTTDIVFTLKYTSLTGFYFEIGPKFSRIKDAEVENSIDESFIDSKDPDYREHFSEKFTNIVAGLGFAIYNGDRLRVNLGLRASYCLSQFVEDDNFYVLRDGYYAPGSDFEAKTSPFSVKFTAGVSYIFGFWGNANCGRGRLVFFK